LPDDEQFHGAVAEDAVRSLLLKSGDVERRNAVDRLTFDPHHFTAGRQNRGAWAQAHHGFGQSCHRVDQVFAIVEQEQ